MVKTQKNERGKRGLGLGLGLGIPASGGGGGKEEGKLKKMRRKEGENLDQQSASIVMEVNLALQGNQFPFLPHISDSNIILFHFICSKKGLFFYFFIFLFFIFPLARFFPFYFKKGNYF